MIGFPYRQQLPLIVLHGSQPVQELSTWLVSLELINSKPVATL